MIGFQAGMDVLTTVLSDPVVKFLVVVCQGLSHNSSILQPRSNADMVCVDAVPLLSCHQR